MRILLVEDDPDLSRQLKAALADAGYAVDHAPDGEDAQFLGENAPYDAVILDLGLPKVDGVSVLERWRRENMVTPALILTARGAWSEKVAGFDAGADDYLTKPFHTEELLARLRALLRRSAGHAAPNLACGGLRLDPRAARASVNGEPLRLARRLVLLAMGWSLAALVISAVVLALLFRQAAVRRLDQTLNDLTLNLVSQSTIDDGQV